MIKKYTDGDKHFLQVQKVSKRKNLSEDDQCQLSFALAKMYEDIGDMDKSFTCLTKGNSLRKQLLNYSIDQDKSIFSKLKITQPYLLKNALGIKESSTEPTPVFILGMPRSGTTLLEQIISAHTEVDSLGETEFLGKIFKKIDIKNFDLKETCKNSIFYDYIQFTKRLKINNDFLTDKSLLNFQLIGFIKIFFSW